MSLVSIIGPRPNLLDMEGASELKRLEVRQPILTNEDLEKIRSISEMTGDHFKSLTFDMTYPAEHGADGMGWAIDELVRARRGRGAQRLQHPHPLRPQGRRRPHSDPGAARLRRRAPSSHPPGPAHLGRHGAGDRRAARGAPFRLPGRLRRGSDQPLSRLRDADRRQGRPAAEARREGSRQALHQGDRQGAAQGDVQDGHLHLPVLLRRADLRRGRPAPGIRRPVFHRHRTPASRAWGSPRSPKRPCAATATPSPTRRSTAPCSASAATTPCACAARTTCGPPRRWRSCSTRCAATRRTITAPTRRW